MIIQIVDMTHPVKYPIAHHKLDIIGGMLGTVSCGQCYPNSTHKIADCIEKEENHKALNLKTEQFEEHYKLTYYCPKKETVAVASAVVWNHEVQE